MKVVFAGTPHAALPSLRALLTSDRHEVVAVLTRPDAPAGRGRTLTPSPVGLLAAEHGLPVLKPERPRGEEFLAELASYDPDCCPVVAYGSLLPAQTLAVPTIGWVNLHFSLLPAWRGAAPVQRALLAGDDITGATTFLIEQGMDTGPIFGVLTELVGARDTAGDLLGRLAESGAGLLTTTLDGIEDGTLGARPQLEVGVSMAPKLRPEDARVDWSDPAVHIDRQVRACTPAPGPWTTWRGERLKLGPVLPVDSAALAPGELEGDRVGTGTTEVQLSTVQPAGRSVMAAADWLRGLRADPHERLGDGNV